MMKALIKTGVVGIFAVASGMAFGANGPDVPVSRGADYVSAPVVPEKFFLDARTRPVVPAWRPGDPIIEIPRQLHGEGNLQRNPPRPTNPVAKGPDILAQLQREFGGRGPSSVFETPLVNIEGQGFAGVFPPDPSGDVGGGYYVQSINGGGGATYEIYNTSDGSVAAGPFNMDGLGSGGACANGYGDGVVVFDQLANRWLLTEFSNSGNRSVRLSQCRQQSGYHHLDPVQFRAPQFPRLPQVWRVERRLLCGRQRGAGGVCA